MHSGDLHWTYIREKEVESCHLAIKELAQRSTLPAYPPDDGLPSPQQLRKWQKAAGRRRGGKVASSLF